MSEGLPLPWLSLLKKPCDDLFGQRASWDLRGPGGPIRAECTAGGLNNRVFRVTAGAEVFACKLFVADERQRARREWTALCSLQAAGRPLAPQPVTYAPDGPLPQPAVVYRWVEGTPLAGRALSAADLAGLLQALAQVHVTPPAAGLEPLTAWHHPTVYADTLAEIRDLAERASAATASPRPAARALPAYAVNLAELLPLLDRAVAHAEGIVAAAGSAGRCPCSGLVRVDGNLENVLQTPEAGLVFVDWEYSGWGDPAYDLADLRWHPKSLPISGARWQAALAAYPPPDGDTTFAERLATYLALLPAWWVARSLVHLVEGAGLSPARPRLAPVPERLYRSVRAQLDLYLAALGLADAPETEQEDED